MSVRDRLEDYLSQSGKITSCGLFMDVREDDAVSGSTLILRRETDITNKGFSLEDLLVLACEAKFSPVGKSVYDSETKKLTIVINNVEAGE